MYKPAGIIVIKKYNTIIQIKCKSSTSVLSVMFYLNIEIAKKIK